MAKQSDRPQEQYKYITTRPHYKATRPYHILKLHTPDTPVRNPRMRYNSLTPSDIVTAYDSDPKIIDGEILEHSDYLYLAQCLYDESRHREAENVLETAMKKIAEFSEAVELYDIIRADRSNLFEVKAIALSDLHFHLDSLKGKGLISKEKLKTFEIRGWVEISESECELIVQEGEGPVRIEKLTKNRPDVVSHLAKKGKLNSVLRCGFLFHANLSNNLRISLRSPRSTMPVVEVSKKRVLQTIEGHNGWLFLNNDSNRSVDIFTGHLSATPSDADRWGKFAINAQAQLNSVGVASCFVIAPSKEDVFPEKHPLTSASISLLSVVVSAIFAAGVPISSPVNRLRQTPDSYYETDTHWSDLGAWICVQDILSILGLSMPEHFKPIFKDIEVIGDLGSKMFPVRRSIRKAWSPSEKKSELAFDNKVSGSGNICIHKNDAPTIGKKVLIFGGSSSNHISRIMADIFREVVRINSPLSMPIMEVVRLCKPDIVLIQSNARYLKSCPKLNNTIDTSSLSKLDRSQMPPDWFK